MFTIQKTAVSDHEPPQEGTKACGRRKGSQKTDEYPIGLGLQVWKMLHSSMQDKNGLQYRGTGASFLKMTSLTRPTLPSRMIIQDGPEIVDNCGPALAVAADC